MATAGSGCGPDGWNCFHSGWLHVRARVHRTWKRRFVVLTEERLSFYKSDQPPDSPKKSGGSGLSRFMCGVGGFGIPFDDTSFLKIARCTVNIDPVVENGGSGSTLVSVSDSAASSRTSSGIATIDTLATAAAVGTPQPSSSSQAVPAAKGTAGRVGRPWNAIWFKPEQAQEEGISGVLFTVVPSKGRYWELLAGTKDEAHKWKWAIDKQIVLVALKQPVSCHNLGKRVKTTPAQEDSNSGCTQDGREERTTEVRGQVDGVRKVSVGTKASFEITLTDDDLQVLGVDVSNLKKAAGVTTPGEAVGVAYAWGGCHIVWGDGAQSVPPLWPDLETSQGCLDFLKSSCLNAPCLQRTSKLLDAFNRAYNMGDSTIPIEVRLRTWKGTIRNIVRSFMEHLLECNPTLRTCWTYPPHMDQLRSAAETWVLSCIHDKIMSNIIQMHASKERELRITLAKLDKLDPTKLGVRKEHKEAVLGEAMKSFSCLNLARTPIEKVICLQRTAKQVMDGIQSVIQAQKGEDKENLLPCTDDLVSLLIVLLAKAKVKNLLANGCFIDEFWEINNPYGHCGERGYHLTNFRAACEHLQSEEIRDLCASLPDPLPEPVDVEDIGDVSGDFRGKYAIIMPGGFSSHPAAGQDPSSLRTLCSMSTNAHDQVLSTSSLIAVNPSATWNNKKVELSRTAGPHLSGIPKGESGGTIRIAGGVADKLSRCNGSFEVRVNELLTAPGLTANTGQLLREKGEKGDAVKKDVGVPHFGVVEALTLAQIRRYLGFQAPVFSPSTTPMAAKGAGVCTNPDSRLVGAVPGCRGKQVASRKLSRAGGPSMPSL